MKHIVKKSYFLVLAIALALFFSSCQEEDTVTPKTVEQYKTELTSYINSEISKVNSCVIGFNKDDFKTSSSVMPKFDIYKTDYLTVLNAALVEVNKPDVTISLIIKAQSTLADAGKLFNSSLWISDRRALNDLVVSCTELNSATEAGTQTGMAPQEVKDALTAAISVAKSARDSGATIQRMVDEAIVKLQEAKTLFLAALVK